MHKIRFSLVYLLPLLLGCEQLNNRISMTRLECGQELENSSPLNVLKILGPEGQEISGSALSAELVLSEANGAPQFSKLKLSSRGCLAIPARDPLPDPIVLRSREGDKFIGGLVTVKDWAEGSFRLQPVKGLEFRPNCELGLFGSDTLRLPLVAGRDGGGLALLKLTIDGKPLEQSSKAGGLLALSEQAVYQVPGELAEGSYTLEGSLENLLQPEKAGGEPFRCKLQIDRTPPKIALQAGSPEEQATGRIRPGALISVSVEDKSPIMLETCLQRLGDQTCSDPKSFQTYQGQATIVAPGSGNWELLAKARDQAGNASELRTDSFSIYNYDKLEILRLQGSEAKNLAGRDPFLAVNRVGEMIKSFEAFSPLEQSTALPYLSEAMVFTSIRNTEFKRTSLERSILALEPLADQRYLAVNEGSLKLFAAPDRLLQEIEFPADAAGLSLKVDRNTGVVAFAYTLNDSTQIKTVLNLYACDTDSCSKVFEKRGSSAVEACQRQQVKPFLTFSNDSNLLFYSVCEEAELFERNHSLWRSRGEVASVEAKLRDESFEGGPRVEIFTFSPDNKTIAYFISDSFDANALEVTSLESSEAVLGQAVECYVKELSFVSKGGDSSLAIFRTEGLELVTLSSQMNFCNSSSSGFYIWPEDRLITRSNSKMVQLSPDGQSFAVLLEDPSAAVPKPSLYLFPLQGERSTENPWLGSTILAFPAEKNLDTGSDPIPAWHYDFIEKRLSLLERYNLSVWRQSLTRADGLLVAEFSQSLAERSDTRPVGVLPDVAPDTWIVATNYPSRIQALSFMPWPSFFNEANRGRLVWDGLTGIALGDQFGYLNFYDTLKRSFSRVKAAMGEIREIFRLASGDLALLDEWCGPAVLDRISGKSGLESCTDKFRRYDTMIADPSSDSLLIQGPKTNAPWTKVKDADGSTKFIKGAELFASKSGRNLQATLQLLNYQGRYVGGLLRANGSEPRQLAFYDFQGKDQKTVLPDTAFDPASNLSSVKALAFAISPDSRYLAWLEPREDVGQVQLKVWDIPARQFLDIVQNAETNAALDRWQRSSEYFPLLKFSPDSKKLAIAVKVRHVRTFALEPELNRVTKLAEKPLGPSDYLPLTLEWFPDSERLLWSEKDRDIFIANADLTGTVLYQVPDNLIAVSVSPDGKNLALATLKRAFVFPTDPREQLAVFKKFYGF